MDCRLNCVCVWMPHVGHLASALKEQSLLGSNGSSSFSSRTNSRRIASFNHFLLLNIMNGRLPMFERVQEQSSYSFVVLARFGVLGAKTYMLCICSHTKKKNQIDNARPCTQARMQKKREQHVYRNLSLCVHHFVNIRTQFLVDMLKRMRLYPLFYSGTGTSN